MARRKEKTPEYFTVEVERLDQEGRGVGHHDGKVVFIEGALPGELVTYERIRNKTSFEIGRVAQVHRESVQRVEPRCPKFGHGPGSCGGCAMQHLEPRAQVAYKERTLIDTLWHIGRVRPEQIITPIYGPFWNYRHRARLTVRDVAKKGGVLVGFHEKSSSYVAEMTGCQILTKNVSDMIMPMRELVSKLSIRQRMPQIEVAVGGNGRTALVFRTLEEPTDGDMALLNAFGAEHKADIWLQPKGPDSAHPVDPANINALGLQLPEFGVRINFKPTDFTQVNHELNETMVSRAVRLLGVEPGGGEQLVLGQVGPSGGAVLLQLVQVVFQNSCLVIFHVEQHYRPPSFLPKLMRGSMSTMSRSPRIRPMMPTQAYSSTMPCTMVLSWRWTQVTSRPPMPGMLYRLSM